MDDLQNANSIRRIETEDVTNNDFFIFIIIILFYGYWIQM
jgi:hypothetical protein